MNTRPEPKRDRWERYLLPVQGQPKPVAHTRVTTLVKALDDTSNLEKWACRMTALGLAERADLRALVASHRDDKAALNRVVDQAKEAARSGAGANTGTALHRFAELVDAGMDVDLGEWADDIAAYRRTLDDAGVRILPEMMERIIRVPGLQVAGTFDRLVEVGGRRYIADIKTGSIEWAHLAIAAQLACYAHGEVWDGGDGYESLGEVDQTRGLIIHLPAGKAECSLHWADLSAGWEAAQLCATVRGWRARGRDGSLVSAFVSPPATAEVPADQTIERRAEWLRDRIASLPAGGAEMLVAAWPEGVAQGRDARRTHADIDAIAAVIDRVEAQTAAAFTPGDPTLVPVPEPTPVPEPHAAPRAGRIDDVTYAGLAQRFAQHPARQVVEAWAAEAQAAGASLSIAQQRTVDQAARFSAALAAAVHGDEAARDLLGVVMGEALQQSVSTGVALAALTAAEADALRDMARALSEGRLTYQLSADGRPMAAIA